MDEYDDQVESEVDVLDDNWDTVQVFLRCQANWLTGGMGAPVYLGISALELDAAIRLSRIPTEQIDEVVNGVRVMELTTRESHNQARSKS